MTIQSNDQTYDVEKYDTGVVGGERLLKSGKTAYRVEIDGKAYVATARDDAEGLRKLGELLDGRS